MTASASGQSLLSPITPSAEEKEKFAAFTWDAMTIGGKIYGYPVSVEAIGLLCNKKLVPEVPENWEDFVKLDDQLKKQGARAVIWDYNTPYFSYPLISANGGFAFKKGADGFYNVDETGVGNEGARAGMKYLVITSKHHDGFALWDSDVSDFDIMNTPYKKDLIAPLVAACKKYGLKYGFYYSHWQDWEDPDGAMPYWYPWRPDEDFEKYWQRKSLPQVKELIEKFDPDLLWFDTWDWKTHITPERRDELIRLVRTYSDKCLINGRICYENPGDNIDFLEMHDNSYPKEMLSKPWQTPATMQNSWAYHGKDYNWKPASRMLRYLVNNTSMGGNYLLNVGPKADGTLPAPAVRRLREMGAWLDVNGEAVFGSEPSGLAMPEGVYSTCKETSEGKNLYLFLTNPMTSVTVPAVLSGECNVVETGQPVEMTVVEDETVITLPENLFKDDSIVVLKCRL